jgi:hypothetical protein
MRNDGFGRSTTTGPRQHPFLQRATGRSMKRRVQVGWRIGRLSRWNGIPRN